MKTDLDMTLYLVTDSTYHTEETFYKTIEEACQGGVTGAAAGEKLRRTGISGESNEGKGNHRPLSDSTDHR